ALEAPRGGGPAGAPRPPPPPAADQPGGAWPERTRGRDGEAPTTSGPPRPGPPAVARRPGGKLTTIQPPCQIPFVGGWGTAGCTGSRPGYGPCPTPPTSQTDLTQIPAAARAA